MSVDETTPPGNPAEGAASPNPPSDPGVQPPADATVAPKRRDLALDQPTSFSQWIEALLKSPWVFFELGRKEQRRVVPIFSILILLTLGAYGALMGTFENPETCYTPALKVALGMMLTSLLCFPSLYILVCLTGLDLKIGQTLGILVSAVGLTALLLVGFAPIAFVFSMSVRGAFFMGAIHLGIWLVSFLFALRFMHQGFRALGAKSTGYVRFWGLMLIVTTLQMSTTLRPLLGTPLETAASVEAAVGEPGEATNAAPEKRFFLEHWFYCLQEDLEAARDD